MLKRWYAYQNSKKTKNKKPTTVQNPDYITVEIFSFAQICKSFY